jgi:hypothetical protein
MFYRACLLAIIGLALCFTPPADFDCPPLAPRNPAVHIRDLHPQDIKVVMGFGDSCTAGFAAGVLLDIFLCSLNVVFR